MIKVYTKNNCPFCDRAKALLESKGKMYISVNIEENETERDFLIGQGLKSVPQIFKDNTLIPGGFQALSTQSEDFWNTL
jgi:glutaredoxin